MKGVKRLEHKLDGVRVLMVLQGNTVTSYSRNGKVFDNFTHIEDDVREFAKRIYQKLGIKPQDGVVFDGEVIGKSFNELMRQARRKTDADAGDSVFHIFDYLPLRAFNEGHWNKQQDRRLSDLENLRGIGWETVELMDGITVDLDTSAGRNQLDRFAKDSVAAGYEGIMIKELQAPYLCKRGLFWMKWKPTITVDLEVIELEEGTGKNVGRLGALVCEGIDHGKQIRVNVGSGFTDEERVDYWASHNSVVGQTVEILCDTISQNQDGTYSLRFPRFVRFRDDK
jgi:DNA ligase-1